MLPYQAPQLAVRVAAKVQPGHGFLPRIAPLRVRHSSELVETDLLGQGPVVDLGAERGPPGQDARGLNVIGTARVNDGLREPGPGRVERRRRADEQRDEGRRVRRVGEGDRRAIQFAAHDPAGLPGERPQPRRAPPCAAVHAEEPRRPLLLPDIPCLRQSGRQRAGEDRRDRLPRRRWRHQEQAFPLPQQPAIRHDHALRRQQRAVRDRVVAGGDEVVGPEALQTGDRARPGDLEDGAIVGGEEGAADEAAQAGLVELDVAWH